MTRFLAHLKVEILELIRLPAYSIPTLILPCMLFAMFGGTRASTSGGANHHLASYATFAVMGIAFFQFGVGIATDRESPWQVYLRILPVGPAVRFAARVGAAVVFAVLSVGLVVALAVFVTPVAMPASAWARFLAALVAGGIPIGLLGIALGYWAGPKSALPIANILYLLLAFGGGIFLPPRALPPFVESVSPFLPTRMLLDISWQTVSGGPLFSWQWLGLAGYAVFGGLLATAGYRRDEGKRYT